MSSWLKKTWTSPFQLFSEVLHSKRSNYNRKKGILWYCQDLNCSCRWSPSISHYNRTDKGSLQEGVLETECSVCLQCTRSSYTCMALFLAVQMMPLSFKCHQLKSKCIQECSLFNFPSTTGQPVALHLDWNRRPTWQESDCRRVSWWRAESTVSDVACSKWMARQVKQ